MTKSSLVALLLSVIACSGPGSVSQTAETWTETPSDAHFLLGVVGQSGVEKCTASKTNWVNVRPTIGFVGVSGKTAALKSLMDEPVLAVGKSVTSPKRKAVEGDGTCFPKQRRNDWVITPRGIRLWREPRPALSHFAVHGVKRLHALAAKQMGSEFEVSFKNPLPHALYNVVVTAHYEGCFGKNSSMQESSAIATIAPGQSDGIMKPMMLRQDGHPRGHGPDKTVSFRAYSVQVRGEGKNTFFDLDVPLAKLNVTSKCPSR